MQQGGKPFTAVRDKQLVPSFLEQRPSALGAPSGNSVKTKWLLDPLVSLGYLSQCASWASVLRTVRDNGLAKRFIWILREKKLKDPFGQPNIFPSRRQQTQRPWLLWILVKRLQRLLSSVPKFISAELRLVFHSPGESLWPAREDRRENESGDLDLVCLEQQ